MYQIGRSSEEPIDFVVADTVPGSGSGSVNASSKSANKTTAASSSSSAAVAVSAAGRVAQSTISRFACRLVVERDSCPARAYIYAAGFDSSRNIFLGVFFFYFLCSFVASFFLPNYLKLFFFY